MSAVDRANKLNVDAVAKLNAVISVAQLTAAVPDLKQVACDVLSGKRVIALKETFQWSTLIGSFFWVALLAAAGTNNVIGVFVFLFLAICSFWPLLSSIRDWFKSVTTLSIQSAYHGYRDQPTKCAASGCNHNASYGIDVSGHTVSLCYEHKNRIENRLRYAPFFCPQVAKMIVEAYQDLVKAAKLNPGAPHIRDNLKQARELAEIVLEQALPVLKPRGDEK